MFHDGVVQGAILDRTVALNDEHVGTTNGLGEPNVGFAVRKLAGVRFGDVDIQTLRHFLGEFFVVTPAEKMELLLG